MSTTNTTYIDALETTREQEDLALQLCDSYVSVGMLPRNADGSVDVFCYGDTAEAPVASVTLDEDGFPAGLPYPDEYVGWTR